MNEWLDEELAELKRKRENKAANDSRSVLLQNQTKVLWQNLKPILKDAVVKMNIDGSEFRKLTGGLAYEEGDQQVKVRKSAGLPPFVELDLSCGPNSVSWEYKVSQKSTDSRGDRRGHVILQVDLDDDQRPVLRQDAKRIDPEQAVRWMLRPFIHPELLEENS